MTDDVLTAFGIVISIVGIVLFVRTKAAGDNSMHVLGMQVKVSHPSLLIFFAGILLVLVPRLLPQGQQPPAAEQGDPIADEGADGVPVEATEPAAEPSVDPEPTAPDEPAEDELAPDEPVPDEPAADEPAADEPAPEEEAAP